MTIKRELRSSRPSSSGTAERGKQGEEREHRRLPLSQVLATRVHPFYFLFVLPRYIIYFERAHLKNWSGLPACELKVSSHMTVLTSAPHMHLFGKKTFNVSD